MCSAARVAEDGQGAADFAKLLGNLAEIDAAGRALIFAHHFSRTGRTDKGRAPGDRMAGSGALFGAMDCGLFITGGDGDRELVVEHESRDIRTLDPFTVRLSGAASGQNESWTYRDAITVAADFGEIKSEADVMLDQLVEILRAEPEITQTAAASKLGTTRHANVFSKAWPRARERVCVSPIEDTHARRTRQENSPEPSLFEDWRGLLPKGSSS